MHVSGPEAKIQRKTNRFQINAEKYNKNVHLIQISRPDCSNTVNMNAPEQNGSKGQQQETEVWSEESPTIN